MIFPFTLLPTLFMGSALNPLMPDFKVGLVKDYSKLKSGSKPKSVSNLDDFSGDSMVFKVNTSLSRRKGRKYRDSDSGQAGSPNVHFEAQLDMLNGKPYLDVEDEDMEHLVAAMDLNGNGRLSKRELRNSTFEAVSDKGLIENHSRDADVTKYLSSEDVFFQYKPEPVLFGKPGPGTLEFNNDIVSVGIDDEGNVISFICPQETQEIDNTFVSGSILSEVEVGQVGGKIDPITGEGTMYADDLAWKFWGDMKIFGRKISIPKEEAAFIPIEDASGSGGLLALGSIEKSAHGGGNIENIFSSYYVNGLQGDPSGIQKGSLQKTLIQAVNMYMPGFANGGTAIEWNIDLQNPVDVKGSEYVDKAHALHMH